MADNVNDSLKNLNNNIKDADANLAKLSKDFNVVFTEAVHRAARDAKVSIDQMFDAIAGRVGASKASKLKLLFDIVDEHGETATPQTIQQKIDRIVNATQNARGTKLHIGMDWVDVDTANANLRRYKEQLKLIQDMPAAYDLVNRAVNTIIGEFDKEAEAKQKIIEKNEKILEQEIAIEEKQRSKAAAQQQKQEEKQYKEEQKWYDAKAKADRENERRAGEAKYRQMSKEIAEYGKALQRQIELETKANQIRRDYNKIKSDLQGVSKQSEEYKKGQQVLQQYRQELHNVYQEQKKIDNEYKGTRSAVYNQQRINGLRQEYEQLRRNGRQMRENKDSLESMLPTLRRIASAFGVAFSVQGLVNFGRKLVETRGEFEMQFVAMKQIIGDVDAATKIWNQTMQQALQSPFRAMQLVDYTKKLAAYRIETDKLFDTTKRLADVSAGLGVDMGRLILAYGQVKTANYLRASEVRQFTEAGVNIYGELAKYFSEIEGHAVSTAEVVERTSKRMVLFSDVEAIFKRMTDEGGTFFNMQEVQSDTVRGQIMKLHDAYDQMLNTIGESNQGTIRDLVDTLNKLVRNWQDIAYVIKFNLSVFLPYIAATKVAALGMKRAGDASLWFSNKLIGQRVALSSTNEILKLNSATLGFWHRSLIRATEGVQAFVLGLKSIGWAVLPFAIIEGIIFLTEKISEAHRAATRLKEDLESIKFGNAESLQSNIQGFERLKKAIEDSNEGSQERLRLIEQMNNKYGDYLPHLITEIDTVQQLNDAYDSVIQSMREYSYAKTKEQGEERIRKEMFEVYNDAVNDLFGTKSNRQVSYGRTGSFYLEKHEIQDILKQIQDELIKDPELNGQTLVQRLIANYTGIQEAHVDYAHIWAGYIEDMRNQVKEMQNLERYAEEAVSPSYRSGEERSRAEELRKKAEAELAAANEAWAKEKDSLTHTIEDSVLKGIQDARKEAAKVDREEGESDAEYNMKLWNARVKADEDANKAIKQQHIITNFAIEEKEKEHQARLLKIRLSNQQISAESYNKQMLAIYPELDDRIKQYNDKIRAMIVGQFGEEWSGNADAITLFKQMRIGIDDISQGVAQYQKNFAGTVENQIKIVQDLYDWKERGYNIDENDLNVQREKLAVYVRMARLLGVKTDYNPIGSDLFTDIQRQFNNKYGNKPTPYLPFGNTFFGLEEGDRMLSQIELLDKYTKKWKEYEKTYKTLVKSKKNNKDLSEAAAADLDAQIEEAKKNTEASKFLIDLLGYIAKSTRGGGQKESVSRLISLIKEMRSEYDKLSKSAYGYAKSEEKVRASFGDSWEAILKEAGVPKDFDFSTNAGEIAALERVRDYVKGNAKFAKDAWKDVQKVIDQLKTESEIEVQVRIREDFGRQMEEAFGNYELTLELQKLNLPKGVAAEMWGIEETDLQDLRARLTEMYNGLRDENGQLYTDAFKDYEKFLNKIDDLERKQQRERLKDYAKYLETQYSDRVKIEMEYIQKLSRLEAETAIPEAQKEAIREGLRREFDEKSRKQDWEDFKGSEFYVEMMEDLEKQGTASLEVMRKKLLEMRANAENLSPRALKEVVNALEKIDEIERNRTQPLKRVRDAQRALEGVNMKDVYEELAINQEQLALSEEEERSMERAIMLIQKRNELEEQGYTIEEARVRLSQANQARDFAQSAFDSFKSDGTKEAQDNLATLEQVLNSAKADVEKWQEIVNILSGQAIIDEQAKGNKYTTFDLGELQERRKNLKQSIKDLEGVIGKEEELAKLNKELNDAWDATYEAIKGWASSVQNVFDGVMDNVDYFSDSTYGMVTAWKEFGDTSVSALNDLVSGIQAYRKANAEAEKDKAATGLFTANGLQLALVVLSVLMKIIQAIAKQHDAALDKQIQFQQERIDALKDAYARLEKQIERTWSSVSYMQTYEQQVQNIREQISAMEAQMAAEREKKNTDDNAVRQYQRDIQDAYDQLDELKQKSIEVFGGIGEEGYRSAAEGFVEAWKSAFLETGDGLQGLQDHFDEFLQEWFVKQATMRIAGNMLQPMFEMIDKAVDPSSNGGVAVTMHELEALRDWAGTNFPIISDTLEDLAGMFGVGGEGSLSGLAAGIQGMTEEQANILEAYWNSVRMYTASIDINVSRIADMLGAGGGIETNPMLAQMRLIAQNTNNISTLLNAAVVKGVHPYGDAFKVVIN